MGIIEICKMLDLQDTDLKHKVRFKCNYIKKAKIIIVMQDLQNTSPVILVANILTLSSQLLVLFTQTSNSGPSFLCPRQIVEPSN